MFILYKFFPYIKYYYMLNNKILIQALYDRKLNVVDQLLKDKNVISHLDYANEKGETAFLLTLHFDMPQYALKILQYSNIGLEQIDGLKNSTLILALKKQYEEIGLKILQKGFKNINYVDANGDTSLTCALRYNHQSVVNQLFTYKNLDVNIVDEHGDNALLIAIDNEQEENALKILNLYNVNMDYVQKKHNFNALNLAICKNLEKVAHTLVDKGADTSFVSNTGDTALFCALNHDMFSLANKISRTKDPNVQNVNQFQDVALGQAINTEDEEMCLEIYKKDQKNVETVNQENDTTLILALTHSMYKLSSLLVENGSEKFIRHINNNQDSALFLCITNGYWDLAKIIIQKKYYDVNQKNLEEDCLMHYLMNYGDEKLALQVFYDNKDIIDVNVVNVENNSLLILSIINGMENLALGYVDKMEPSLLNQLNFYGDNALILAISNQMWKLTEKLITNKQVDINFITKNNDNALLLLVNSRQWPLVEILLKNPLVNKHHRNRLNAYEILTDWNIHFLLHYF